jgi:lysozyme family protein
MSDFDLAIGPLLEHEGEALVADDHGRGPSKWGITLKTLQESDPDADADTVKNLTRDDAEDFYGVEFWDKHSIGQIEDQAVANKVLDLAVNMGPGTAIGLLQKALAVTQDGVIGPVTAGKANQVPPDLLLASLREAAKAHYQRIVKSHPEYAACLPGWLKRLDS